MPNRLIHASSPYLLQHAHNPVDWYPWGPEALERARSEQKPMLISIGYAACHWCHVMERESFEDPDIAQLMNEHFVCIKVDREERPDIDQTYMDAVMLMTGRGGWPLNAFALPDGRPIYGGTYFPRESWKQVLNQVSRMTREAPQRAESYARDLTAAMLRLEGPAPGRPEPSISREDLETITQAWVEQMDRRWGGRRSSGNKFPLPANTRFLLRAAHLLGQPEAREAAVLTLEKMAFGGIYDHLGGGFARYSVDPHWKVPHFEKMLYDNGQLLSTYSEAWLQTRRDRFREVVQETIAWVLREMTSPEGGFYSSLDADSEGEEGKYYVWSYEEAEALLGPDIRTFAAYYNLHPFGNWEGSNVLFVLEEPESFAAQWQLDAGSLRGLLARCRAALFGARSQRVRPGLDDKILASWNALMLKGLVDAYTAFGEPAFLDAALRNAVFIREQMMENGRLFRSWKNGQRSIPAFLDDYAFLADAWTALYQATFDEQWLHAAAGLAETVLARFEDPETGFFFFTSDESEVVVRRKLEIQDDVIPASNAAMAHVLHSLGLLLDRPAWRERAQALLHGMQEEVRKSPAWHAHWAALALKLAAPHYEVACTGPGALRMRLELEQHYHPNRIFAGAAAESELPLLQGRLTGQDMIYVCEGYSCRLPVRTAQEAAAQMRS
ncbi:MAG: thioredoxin domain-containing protein [Bacteroidia bacterium]|nr:thioredoxin domain-containing protein [Bacteroidia bacterium]